MQWRWWLRSWRTWTDRRAAAWNPSAAAWVCQQITCDNRRGCQDLPKDHDGTAGLYWVMILKAGYCQEVSGIQVDSARLRGFRFQHFKGEFQPGYLQDERLIPLAACWIILSSRYSWGKLSLAQHPAISYPPVTSHRCTLGSHGRSHGECTLAGAAGTAQGDLCLVAGMSSCWRICQCVS